eukprot:45420_1
MANVISDFTSDDGHLEAATNLPLLDGRYRVLRTVGKGAFSRILEAEDVSGSRTKRVAIKCINAKYPFIGRQAISRLACLNVPGIDLDCFNIVKLQSSFEFGRHLCLVFDLVGPNLMQRMRLRGTFSLKQIRKIAFQLIVALGWLHRNRLIHADIKPENILLYHLSDNVSLKLIDFGNAMKFDQVSAYKETFRVQTLHYRAPEVLLGSHFGAPIDMWSLGCLLIAGRTGEHLFKCANPVDLFEKMTRMLGPLPLSVFQNGKFAQKFLSKKLAVYDDTRHSRRTKEERLRSLRLNSIRLLIDASASACDSPVDLGHFATFVEGLLAYDPARRLTPQAALAHPFLLRASPVALLLGPDPCLRSASQTCSPSEQQRNKLSSNSPKPIEGCRSSNNYSSRSIEVQNCSKRPIDDSQEYDDNRSKEGESPISINHAGESETENISKIDNSKCYTVDERRSITLSDMQ